MRFLYDFVQKDTLAEATALLTELENQEPMSDADAAASTSTAGVDSDALENTPTTVHFTTDPVDENEVFDQHM